jgi:excisionase family DNA binding protein
MEDMMSQRDEKLLTVKEVAQKLRISQATVLNLIDSGEFPGAFKAGNQWRIPESVLEDYIRRQSV